MASIDQSMPSLLDRELSAVTADAFGHRHFSKALESLIESPTLEPPYSIGLLGKWGTGKSTIKELYLSALKDDVSKDDKRRTRAMKIRPIIFNAWRFGGENIKRALLRQVFLALGGDESQLTNALFRQIQRAVTEKRSWQAILRDASDKWVWSLPQVVFVYGLILLLLYLVRRMFGLSGEWPVTTLTALLAITGVVTLKYLLDPKRFLIPRYTNITQIEPPSASAEQYEELLLAQLRKFKAGDTPHKDGKDCERIVIFVDDLDRLSAEEMVSGLDAVRTFMEIPKQQLPPEMGIVFVISCDEERIAQALADRRAYRNGSDLPGTVFNRTDARRYLDRIFQFRLEIPDFPKQDMRAFARQKFEGDLSDIAEDLKQRQVRLDSLIDRMIHVGVQSPRNAIQILNAFAQSWWLALQREREGAGTEKPGGLQEGAVTAHPLSLAALCALRVDFPDFYDDLQDVPDLLTHFTAVFIRGLPFDHCPESARTILLRYCIFEKRDDNDDNTVYPKLKTEHLPLRQFLANLQGLRWPVSLQPLLLLSQDAVTRQYGDRARRIFDALVSGNHPGVLEALGREHDAKPLTRDDARMLASMEEELRHETDLRRNHAAAVLAALANRFPEDQAQRLLSPLARRLADVPELRWRLGIEKIRYVLPRALPEDRRQVAGRLVDDLLQLAGEVDFRLETGQPPSLDEALTMARDACSLVLNVWEQDGLDEPQEKTLLMWLEVRRVAVGRQEQNLPFDDLEAWMQEHEDALLQALGDRYTHLLATQLEDDATENLDINQTIARSRKVFQRLRDEGEESRPVLWDQLGRYAAVRTPEAVQLAWAFMNDNLRLANSAVVTAFVAKLAERLDKQMSDMENWELDREAGGQALLTLVETKKADISTDAHASLATLAHSWYTNDDTLAYGLRLVNALQTIDKGSFDTIIAEWTGQLPGNLVDDCIVWLAENFMLRLSDSQRDQIMRQLRSMFQNDNHTEQVGQRYKLFMDHLSRDAFEIEPIQAHLQQMFTNIEQRHSNPNNYLHRVFPAVVRFVSHGPSQQVGSSLHNLFSNAKGNPGLFGWLHGQMVDHWPAQHPELQPYNPQQNFSDARDVANQHPGVKEAADILRSIHDMVQRNIVSEGSAADVVDTACVLWPHHRRKSLSALRAFEVAPSEQRVTALMDTINAEDPDEIEDLSSAWSHLTNFLGLPQRQVVTTNILTKPSRGSEQEPDLCLRLWLTAQDDNQAALLQELIVAKQLTDEQRKRVWLQVERTYQVLGQGFFTATLPVLFTLVEMPNTQHEVLGFKNSLNSLFPTASDRYRLGQTLLKSFSSSLSQEMKNGLATWIKEINAENVLKELEDPTDEDISILLEHFPRSHHLRQYSK